MTVYAFTVGRNEAHRYLDSFCKNVHQWANEHFFFDDDSTDETPQIAGEWVSGFAFRKAHPQVPSFAENEGLFREGAWHVFEEYMHPKLGDWVLSIDCDEMLVTAGRHIRTALDDVIEDSVERPVSLNIPEVFGFDDDGTPFVRVDGLWGTIHAPRLFPYRPGGSFFPGKVGVPGVPSYVMSVPWSNTTLIDLMHFGHAKESDSLEKYMRYRGIHGHSQAHVESIISPTKSLVRWPYPLRGSMIYRGDR